MVYALYIASALGAVGLYLMMPRPGYTPRAIGALIGAATLGGLWLYLSNHLPAQLGIETPAFTYQYLFSALAIAAAARVITHTKPVYSALWFVMVVLSSAGLFLTLDAEFMAFALVIIYAGAILVTYLFVIMLAAQSNDAQGQPEPPEYDRLSLEPIAAVAAGFILLALLLTAIFAPLQSNPDAAGPSDDQIIADVLTDRAINRLGIQAGGDQIALLPESLAADTQLDNVERIGLDLFRSQPLGLELAGVILLVSLVGAVVIARKQVAEEHTPTSPAAREPV